MGFLDSLFSSAASKGGVPGYLKGDYEKEGLDPENEGGFSAANAGQKMYCTQCRKIYIGGYKCRDCNNILVEWH